MSTSLYPYYESELRFIRKTAAEFARKYPVAAARLQLEPERSTDPHVERLIEAFALLTGRIRHKLHDEFPELTDAMLSVLYPHSLAPTPSFATVQFTLDPAQATPTGRSIPAGSPLQSSRLGDMACRYRTAYPLTLWPIEIAEAKLHPPPFPPGLVAPHKAHSALRLRLRIQGEMTYDKLAIGRLILHLVGDSTTTAPLYDLIFNHTIGASVYVQETAKSLPIPIDEAIRTVGFDSQSGLIPYPPNVFPGYRLLSEYFSYPAKFLYVDLGGFDKARILKATKQFDLVLFLNKSHQRLEALVEPALFRTGCTPIVNLFEQTAEPIPLTHQKPEYRVTPDVSQPLGFEVHTILSVTAASTDGGDREFRPFYHFQHSHSRHDHVAFWHSTRHASQVHDDRGTDVFLHLSDPAFDPSKAATETLVVRTLCTNRDLPSRLPRIGDEVRFETVFASPGTRLRCVRNPTGSLRGSESGRYWHLIGHLNLNALSLVDDEAAAGLKALLRLYDLNDPEAEPHAAALARQSISGIERITTRRVTEWIGSGEQAGFARGLEILLELNESNFTGVSGYLFATVLERFFALHTSLNSFTRLVAKFRQQDGVMKRWPARAGERPLA